MDSTDESKWVLPKANLATSLQILLRNARLIRSNLAAQIDRLDRVEMELTVLSSWAAGEDQLGAWIGEKPGSMICHLAIQNNPNDSIDVEINSSPAFHLSPRLAGLFLFLAESAKVSRGRSALPPWHSRNEVICFLEQRMQGKIRPQYVNNLIHSLRKVLSAAGHDPGLIQSHLEKGVRLALRSKHLSKKAGNSKEKSVISSDSS
jgi:hypothetical protein